MTYFKKLSLFTTALLFISLPLLAQPEPEAEPYIVDLTATDYAFAMPTEIKSGWVTFRFNNIGKETHVAQILHLKNNISYDEYDSLRTANPGRFIPPVDKLMGGPGLHTSGESSEITVNLPPGSYLMACGVSNEGGTQHLALGMMKYFAVTEQQGAEAPPIADMRLELDKYQIAMEGELNKGTQTIEVDGHDADYDVHLLALKDSSTLEAAFDYFRDLRDPHPATILSGVEEGYTTYITVNFSPGDYAWSSHEYGQYGMYQKFTINPDGTQILKDGSVTEDGQRMDVNIISDGIDAPVELAAGRKQMHVHVDDSLTHKPRIARLKEGYKIEDYIKWVRNSINGSSGNEEIPRQQYNIHFEDLEGDDTQKLSVELFPGRYILYCVTPVGEDSYHLLEGEIKEISVK